MNASYPSTAQSLSEVKARWSLGTVRWLIVLVAMSHLCSADTFRIRQDTAASVGYIWADEGIGYGVHQLIDFGLEATVVVPGFKLSKVKPETLFQIAVSDQEGYLNYAFLAGAGLRQSNCFTFRFPEYQNATMEVCIQGDHVKFTVRDVYKGSVPVVSLDHLIGGSYDGETTTGGVGLSADVGSYHVGQVIRCQATTTSTINTVGLPPSAQSFILDQTRLTGATGPRPRSVRIDNLHNGQRIPIDSFPDFDPVLLIKGQTTDTNSHHRLTLIHNLNSYYFPAIDQTRRWEQELRLEPGTNIISVFMEDEFGAEASRKIQTEVLLVYPLEIAFDPEMGSISPTFQGRYLVPGTTYRATAKPKPGFVFYGWSNGIESIESKAKSIDFVMAPSLNLNADFRTNPWPAWQGHWAGLYLKHPNPQESWATIAGSVALTMTKGGAFSGRVTHRGVVYPISGRFPLVGQQDLQVVLEDEYPWLQLYMWLPGGEPSIRGYVAGPDWWVEVALEQAADAKKYDLAPYVGNYTFVLPGEPANAAAHPGGDGTGVLRVKSDGSITVAGKLGEGTPFTQSGALTLEGRYPWFSSLYGRGGIIAGWTRFLAGSPLPRTAAALHQVAPVDDLPDLFSTNTLSWLKPARAADVLYPDGFSMEIALSAFRYQPRATNLEVVNWTNGVCVAAGGGLEVPSVWPAGITNGLVLVSGPGTNQSRFQINRKTGYFTGSFVHPETQVATPCAGVMLQARENQFGAGWFPSERGSGSITLLPQPAQ